MLAHAQGSLLNAAGFARSLGVDGKSVARYLDLLVDLLRLGTTDDVLGHPVAGASWT
jgi:hypothetical protein